MNFYNKHVYKMIMLAQETSFSVGWYSKINIGHELLFAERQNECLVIESQGSRWSDGKCGHW